MCQEFESLQYHKLNLERMKIAKAIWKIFLLVTVLTIPRLIVWLLNGIIRVLVIIKKTIAYLIKLVEEEINPTNHEEIPNSKN